LTTAFLRHSGLLFGKYRAHWYRTEHFLGDCSAAAEQICAKTKCRMKFCTLSSESKVFFREIFSNENTQQSKKCIYVVYGQRKHCECILRKEITTSDNTVLQGLGTGNYCQWHKTPKQNRMGDTQTFHLCPCFTPQDSSVV